MSSGDYGEGGKKPPNIQVVDLVHEEEMNIDRVDKTQFNLNGTTINVHSKKVNNNKNQQRNCGDNSSFYKNTQDKISTGDDMQISTPSVSDELIHNNYDLDHTHLYEAPYFAYIQHKQKNVGRLHEMVMGHILHYELGLKKSIKEISRAGVNRVKVEMFAVKDVIDLVNNPILKSKNLHCYVPKHLTERRGVIRYVDTSLSEDFLKQNIDSTCIVKQVRRVKKKVTKEDGTSVLTDRQTVVVTFGGNKLPPYIFINSCRREVVPYVYNVIRCYKCLRFGHVIAQCRSADHRCKLCGTSHDGTCDESTHSCVHCQSKTHNALSNECPSYKREKLIKVKMAENNYTYKEAERYINNPGSFSNITSNRFALFTDLNDTSEFPGISSNRTRHFTQTNGRNRPPLRINLPEGEKHNNQNTKKRKVVSPNFAPIQREFDPRLLPLNPLPANPHSTSTSDENRENIFSQLVENLTEYVSAVINKSVKNNNLDKKVIRTELQEIIRAKGVGQVPETV